MTTPGPTWTRLHQRLAPLGRAVRRHAAFAALLAVALPWIIRFAHGPGIASIGDDSVSYLLLARHMVWPSDALVGEWIGHLAHFPPAFPLVLALSGAAAKPALGYIAVGAFAAFALVPLYRFCAGALGSNRAAAVVVLLFLLTPSAWISLKGILSESMFLALSMATLAWHRSRLESRDAARGAWLAFGVLLALAFLTRAIGIALVLAYVLHASVRMLVRRERPVLPLLLPLLPLAAATLLWLWWRPVPEGDNYAHTVGNIAAQVARDGMAYLARLGPNLLGGWIASFTVSSHVHAALQAAVLLVGAFGLAGAILRAARNRLDGWYVLISLAIISAWLFPEDNTRRLLYPLLPLLLLQAADFLRLMVDRAGLRQRRALVFAIGALLTALCALPAWLLVQQKSFDRAPLYPGRAYAAADITDYYTMIGLPSARALAGREVATIEGLQALERITPPGAKVMWMRPDYIAALGHRRGVASYYRWNEREFARNIREQGVDYLVVTTLSKADMSGELFDAGIRAAWALQFGRVVHGMANPVTGATDYLLFEIDRPALDRYLGQP